MSITATDTIRTVADLQDERFALVTGDWQTVPMLVDLGYTRDEALDWGTLFVHDQDGERVAVYGCHSVLPELRHDVRRLWPLTDDEETERLRAHLREAQDRAADLEARLGDLAQAVAAQADRVCTMEGAGKGDIERLAMQRDAAKRMGRTEAVRYYSEREREASEGLRMVEELHDLIERIIEGCEGSPEAERIEDALHHGL